MATPSNNAKILRGQASNDLFIAPSDEEWVFFGEGGDDIIQGGEGRDFLYGGEGSDHLDGRGGNDFLDGGADDDLLDGGNGLDSINYHHSNDAVTVNLGTGEASGGHAEGDTLVNVEYVRGSTYDDVITGDEGGNFLCGIGGDDALYGMGGDDVLRGAEGADFMDGGSGFDTLTYWSSDAGVTVDFRTGTGQGGHAEGDSFTGMEAVKGSEHHDDVLIADDSGLLFFAYGGDDTLLGGDGKDRLYGGEGDDLLEGGKARDWLDGGSGSDSLLAGNGHDVLIGGSGDDVLAGGAGRDQFRFHQGDGQDVLLDFEADKDKLIFADGETSWRDVSTVQIGEDVAVYYGESDMVLIEDTNTGAVWDSFEFW